MMRALDIADCINETCPWSGEPVQADSLTEYDGHVVGFCNPGCLDKFESAVRHFEEAKASRAAPGSRPAPKGRVPGRDESHSYTKNYPYESPRCAEGRAQHVAPLP